MSRFRPDLSDEPAVQLDGVSLTYERTGEVLSEIDLVLRQGSFTFLTGPSGAGKSSLLNVLAGRVSTGGAHRVEGTVGVNGHAIDPLSYRENIAYVMQEDAITRTATPREALEFSAALRLDRDVPDGMRRELVSDMLSSLALESVADTMVGSTLIRGISGGEMKRTTIGVELVTQPELLFLDEPTSGLDSNSAFNVIATLRHLARSGCSVLCTIHQPSSEIFHMFDTVLLMNAGELLYSGPCAEVAKTFACPLHHNPADHAMRMLQSDTAQMRKMAAQHKVESVSEETLAPGTPATGVSSSTAHRFKASFWQQTSALAQREWRNTMRDKASLAARFIMTLFLGLFSACIFYQAGDFNRPDYSLNSHFGAVVNLCIGGMFGSAQPMILLFPYERPIFLREYATGTYGAIPYFMSKIIVEITLAFLTQCEMMLISYWLVGFHGNWMLWTLVLWLLALVASSTALLLGCLLTQVKQAMEAAPGIFVPQIIFSGFFIRIQQIPVRAVLPLPQPVTI